MENNGIQRRIHPPAFKAKVALEALKEQKTIAELASLYGVHTTQIKQWKQQAIVLLTEGFGDKRKQHEKDKEELVEDLYKQIGKQKVAIDWLKKRLASLSKSIHLGVREKKSYIEKQSALSLGEQTEMLGISRSSIYYQARPEDAKSLLVMNKIDEVYTASPFYGSRRIAKEVSLQLGEAVNRKRIQGLMQEMGIQALYPKPNLSKSNPAHMSYPYLLKGVTAGYPNHIWGTDITYIRMQHGFLYLVAYLDWFSRYVLSWRLSTTLELPFVLEAAEEALITHGAPFIENNDQGSHFTSEQHRQLFESRGTKISMDHRGRAFDNIFTERLWRTIKYEEVYLKSYQTVPEAKENMNAYINFYNNKRLHQSHGYKTPREIYEAKGVKN